MSEWVDYSLGEIATIEIGGTPSRGVSGFWASEGAEGFPWVSIGDLNTRVIFETKERITARGVASSNVKRVHPGSLIMSFKLSIGRAALAGVPLFTNEAIATIVPRDSRVDSGLLYYILPPEAKNAITDTAVKGATLNKSSLAKLRIRAPREQSTQQKIARILQTLDRAIERTEALIEKYQQIKAGLMHDLFTRGLWTQEEIDRGDPQRAANEAGLPALASAKPGQLRPPRHQAPSLYKETPIGWIPKAWEVKELGRVAAVDRGKFTARPRNDPQFYGGEYPFIQTGNVTASLGRVLFDYDQTLNRKGLIISRLFSRGTIVVTIAANIADTCILGIDMCMPDSLVGVIPHDGSETRFIERCINLKKPWLYTIAPQSAQKNINLEDLRPLQIPWPSKREREHISEIYETNDKTMASHEAELTKLQKQKSGLMHDLLTGKRRVKGEL